MVKDQRISADKNGLKNATCKQSLKDYLQVAISSLLNLNENDRQHLTDTMGCNANLSRTHPSPLASLVNNGLKNATCTYSI